MDYLNGTIVVSDSAVGEAVHRGVVGTPTVVYSSAVVRITAVCDSTINTSDNAIDGVTITTVGDSTRCSDTNTYTCTRLLSATDSARALQWTAGHSSETNTDTIAVTTTLAVAANNAVTDMGSVQGVVSGTVAAIGNLLDSSSADSIAFTAVTLSVSDAGVTNDAIRVGVAETLLDAVAAGSAAAGGVHRGTTLTDAAATSGDASGESHYTGSVYDGVYVSSEPTWAQYGHALVANRNTGGLSRYEGIQIVGMFDTPDGVLLVSPDGFFTLSDSGVVSSRVTYGVDDFKRTNEFRIENLWVDVTDGAGLSATLSTMGASPQVFTYPIENRASVEPRTTRFVPGRGMVGRYWGIQMQSELPFEIYGISVDLAESRRRV